MVRGARSQWLSSRALRVATVESLGCRRLQCEPCHSCWSGQGTPSDKGLTSAASETLFVTLISSEAAGTSGLRTPVALGYRFQKTSRVLPLPQGRALSSPQHLQPQQQISTTFSSHDGWGNIWPPGRLVRASVSHPDIMYSNFCLTVLFSLVNGKLAFSIFKWQSHLRGKWQDCTHTQVLNIF